jgi:predicted metal-dependent phosphoesterase TrpH
VRIDLHTHTTASDGLLAPAALVQLARDAGVSVLAVADHDTTAGVDAAREAGVRLGVEVIPAVEINTDVEASEIHVLGYYVDHAARWFQEFLGQLRDGREHRAERMVAKLNALGIPVEYARVRAMAEGAVGRPHVARALIEAGAVRTIEEAFQKYIGRGGPAYVERMKVTPEDAVRVILRAGGIPVLAHPGWGVGDELLPSLVDAGLQGIEAYYPDHTPSMTAHYLDLADRYHLLVTGGTDFHGGELATRVGVGSQYVPPEVVERLKARRNENEMSTMRHGEPSGKDRLP